MDVLSGELTSLKTVQTARMDPTIFQFYTLETSQWLYPKHAVSRLDLAAPKNARNQYDRGYGLLLKRQLPGAIEHLCRAIAIYPNYVAAHNMLGVAYLNSGQARLAHEEFAKAVALDDHLPGSHVNLGCAQMQLNRFAEAEESLKRAAALAPTDVMIGMGLTYAQFKNHNYSAAIATTHQVHRQKHEGAALVHLLAASAWEAQDRLAEANDELETLLSENPKSPLAGQLRKMVEQLKTQQASRAQMKRAAVNAALSETGTPAAPNENGATAQVRQASQEIGGTPQSDAALEANSGTEQTDETVAHQVIRVAVEEVAMLFAVTDHGKAVTDLTEANVKIQDDGKPPEAVLGFHNVTQLPLRIGLLIDVSNSITDRFMFEVAAASKFLDTAVTDKDDLAFVIGFNCSVLLAQDFTSDKALTARALSQLAPGGGTGLWDAVAFGAEKMQRHRESQSVARILVVISDGEDNSSRISLQQAIWQAQRGEVAVYTVSTKEDARDEYDPLLGNRGLKKLSEETGGSTFTSGSLSDIGKRLANLQQLLRGRYLVYYSPAFHKPDGRYHAVEIRAEKDGHNLKVIARKGYYASALADTAIQ